MRRSALILVAAAVFSAPAARAQVRVQNGVLIATGDNVEAAFDGVNLKSLKNLATGEETIAREGPGWMDLSLQQPTGEGLKVGAWSVQQDPATGASTGILTASDSVRTVTVKVGVDAASGEISLRFVGSASRPGVRSMFFGLQGFDPEKGRFIIPGQAGIYFDSKTTPNTLALEFPTHWESQFVIYETALGGMLVYARDPKPYFKRIQASRQYGTLDLGLEMFAMAPWASAQDTPDVEWRLRPFSGSWKRAVDAYRSWSDTVLPKRERDSSVTWRDKVNAVVTVIDAVPGYLERLAEIVQPEKTLLYVANWRKDSYDVNYPDYTPGPYTAEFVKRAHDLGFHVMLHINALGVATYNPAYEKVAQYQLRDPDEGKLVYWPQGLWPAGPPPPFFIQSFAFISPCSSEYRALLLDSLRPMMEQLHPDALHLDAGGVMLNDGNGLIEGMTSIEGMIRLHQDLAAAYPGVSFSYESMTEVLSPMHDFAQRWSSTYPPHPVSTYLMGDRVTFYGFLNQTPPDEPGFIDYIKRYEAQGILPTFHVYGFGDLDGSRPRNRMLLNVIRAWQQYDFRPDWSADWNGAIFRYVGSDGSTRASVEDSDGVVRLTAADQLLYQRVRKRTSLKTSGFIRDWTAYDDTAVFGLDEEREYWIDTDVPRPSDRIRISGLPDHIVVGSKSLATHDYGYFALDRAAAPPFDFIQNFDNALLGTSYTLKDYGVGFGALIQISRASIGGEVRSPVLLMQPPYRLPGAVTFVEYQIQVPANSPVFKFTAGLSDDAVGSDGAIFLVRVNGADAWKQVVKVGQPSAGAVDLGKWAGQTVRLRLIVHPGMLLNSTRDIACWFDMRLEHASPSDQAAITIAAAPDVSSLSLSFSGAADQPVYAGTAVTTRSAVPASFAVFAKPPAKLELGGSLLDLPFDVWRQGYGGWPFVGRYGTSGNVDAAKSGGETDPRALAVFPPPNGLSLVTWAIHVPANASLFSFRVGLGDPLPPLPDKVDYSETKFAVQVNGEEVWSKVLQLNGWISASVDVSKWAGRDVVLQVSVDALGQGTFNWAYWSRLMIE